MRYNFFQKTLSFFLIFSLLFSVTFRLPLDLFLASSVFARESEFNNLVSILVEEDIYSIANIRSRIERYARDVQSVLENTRTVIIPVPSDASVYDIASLNEKLYQEGYKSVSSGVNFESRLIGTVLVGEIPIPFVHDNDKASRSLLPYIDFVDKAFVYNHINSQYERRDTASTKLQPEIWHGVIQPNTGLRESDLEALRDYFDKNHDFYRAEGVFSPERNIISGRGDISDDYQPFVFYYDQFRENKGLQYDRYVGYEMYLDNIEDINYNRYTRELAERVSSRVLGIQNDELIDLVLNVDPEFDIIRFQNNGAEIANAPEITTKYITDNVVNAFVEIFNGATLSEMRKNVYNAGRYNQGGNQVNIDMPPFLISTLDEITSGIIKNVNTSLERQITDIVANGLSREIPIQHNTLISGVEGVSCGSTYTNFYYGRAGQNLESARDCTIYRGSIDGGTLVEANRGYNVLNVGPDVDMCGQGMRYDVNSGRVTDGLTGFWGGNSPVNLSQSPEGFSSFELGPRNLQRATRPLFDILGSKEIDDESRIPSPLNCFNDGANLLTYNEQFYTYNSGDETYNGCRIERSIPLSGGNIEYYTQFTFGANSRGIELSPTSTTSLSRYCAANNPTLSNSSSFNHLYSQNWGGGGALFGSCLIQDLRLEGSSLKQQRQAQQCESDGDGGTTCEPCPPTTTYNFHSIPSYIVHTSPNDEEFALISRNLSTPSLPVDKNRYVDFIGARGGPAPNYGYQRIDFPQLFRVIAEDASELNLEVLAEKTKEHLDSVSDQMNQVIRDANPEALSGSEREIFELLETGEYPDANIDLYASLVNRPLEALSIGGQEKQISYFDTLVFAIYWRNLGTPSSKYKFIFENYLSNQFEGDTNQSFVLPRHKNSYELGYFAAPGDAQNMYIKLDPEQKMQHPYADIIAANMSLRGTMAGMSVSEFEYDEGTFKCGPPDGVMIWEWIPAIICWLQDMLPPKIKIGESSCSMGDLFLSQDEREELEACQGDANNNGINDCLEAKLIGGEITLESDGTRYYYNTLGKLRSEVYDNTGNLAQFDSISYIQYYLEYVDIPADRENIFNAGNTQRIYERGNSELGTAEAKQEASRYVNFTESRIRVMGGAAETFFSVKGQDANIAFSTELVARDLDGNKVIDLQSEVIEVEVRGDRLFLNTYKVDKDDIITTGSNIRATNNTAIYITDQVEDINSLVSGTSQDTERLIFGVFNYAPNGQRLEIDYPLEVILRNQSDDRVFISTTIESSEMSNIYPLASARESGRYELLLRDARGMIARRVFDVFPERAERLEVDMSTTIVETGNNISTHLTHFYDTFDNIASGQSYTLEMSIQGDGVVFQQNNSRNLTLQVFEGFRPFRLRSTEAAGQNQIQFTLRDINGELISQVSRTIQVVNSIEVEIEPLDGIPKVGGGTYRYRLRFTDINGNTLNNLSSRASLSLLSLYGRASEGYVEFDNGEVILSLQTRELAGRNIGLEFQLEGGNNHYPYLIDIHPEDPIKVDLNLSRDKIEASPDDSSVLEAVLKDRYNNVVYTDNTTQISLELHERSDMIATLSDAEKSVRAGKAQFQIFGTDIPGTAYFKVDTSPSLGENSFRLDGQAPFLKERLTIPGMKNTSTGELTERGNIFFRDFSENYFITRFVTLSRLEQNDDFQELPQSLQNQLRDFWNETNFLEVNGIGENAGMLETFYFWNKEKIHGNAYNTLHSTLFGSNYGDVSQENYLAGSLLFDRDNAALSVTSLLNVPYVFGDVFQLKKNASLSAIPSGDITQDITFTLQVEPNGILRTDIVNEALSTYIGRLYFLTRNPDYLRYDIIDESYSLQTDRNNITTFTGPAGNRLFRFSPEAGFERFGQVTLHIDNSDTGDGTRVLLSDERVTFGSFRIQGDFDIDITRDGTILNQKKQSLQDTLLIELSSNQYSSRNISNGHDEYSVFYYHDPFAVRNKLDSFHNYDLTGGEKILDEDGIGWKEENRMMLAIAAGETVGEATKNTMSFSLINLGDPVFSLPTLRNNFIGTDTEKSFDSTLGTVISQEDGLIRFEVFDYNNDDRQDILTIHRDGYLRLYERADIEGDFIFQRSLAYAADGGNARLVKTGDFTGDGYEDIFFVDDTGNPQLFNNVEKDFIRIDLSDQLTMSGSIVQVEVFDMDSDGVDDLITLDSAGEIHIWYGNGGDASTPQFTKKFVGDGYSIKLSDTPISHGGAVYYDGITSIRSQNAQSILQMSDSYLQELQASINNGTEAPEPEFMNEDLVNSFLYVPLPYRPTNYSPEDDQREQLLEEFASGVDTTSLGEFGENPQDAIDALDDFTSEWDRYIQYTSLQRSRSQSTFFLRSEYAQLEGIEVRKTFTDETPPHLQTGDIVYLDISLTNTSNVRKDNIAYVDTLPKFFKFKNNEMLILTEDNLVMQRGRGVGNYQILIDGFYLDPDEEVIIRIELEALPLQYGHMQVGIYEQGEPGFDIYGDIIIKESEENCGQTADIYRSIAARDYLKGETEPRCDSDALDIGNTFPGLLDSNNSGIPDYLENILSLEDIEDLQAYSRDALQEFFDVTIPEQYQFDESGGGSGDGGAVDLMGMVDMINGMVDEMLGQLDDLIEGLSCGFGGGSCISMPLNWAPLAPGSVPTLFGMPMGALTPSTGVPVFSGLTGRQTSCGTSPCCLPSVYPSNATAYVPGPACGAPSAGGTLGTWSPFNNVRLYITPTLTGAVGIAACFGGPAIVAGNANPMGVHPLVPGGNCVVAAMPLLGCDGDEGDPAVLGYPIISDDIGLIHANCPIGGNKGEVTPRELFTDFVRDYLEYQRTGVMPAPLFQNYERAMTDVSDYGAQSFQFPNEPLINIGGGDEGMMSLGVDLDLSSLASGGFQDVIQIENKRTPGFPGFLMDWVERQLDEVTSKLTNLPQIFVILPEFGGVFDYSFRDFGAGAQEAFQQGAQENDSTRAQDQANIQSLREQRAALNCSGSNNFACRNLDAQISVANARARMNSGGETLSGIKQVYEFIGKIPLVNIETETVVVSVPWIDPSELNRFTTDWQYGLEQMEREVERAKNGWSFGAACDESTLEAQEACQRQNDIRRNASLQADEFLHSVRHNVEVLQSYGEIPERLAKLINIKEVWLEQILCNIEAIAELMGRWINENGQRFKAWVEVFLLVKAALKSWQSLIDVFIEYEESCHECKNERHDLQNFIWRLISAVIPSPPIIEFPKWPDIILDFHNIRAGMTIYMPDFDINWTPLVLPNLPQLSLPSTPSANFSLP
ncbi:VCBS repeat-containing protein, partial [Candidatus Gracilibacteria bacterium]|nr:VCBS repeat-containing protein [Candidatus Gracilibacteria bacterium]